jgi:hypothetical protein
LFLLLFLAGSATASEQQTSAEIEHLIATVAQADVVFIRNGKEHSAEEAVSHMRRKYDYYKKRIETAEDFIDLAATKSVLSGKLYSIRTGSGETPSGEWLRAALAEFRKAQAMQTTGTGAT